MIDRPGTLNPATLDPLPDVSWSLEPDVASAVAKARAALADHDQGDYVGLGEKMQHIAAMETEVAEAEDRWFELSEELG